MAQKLLLFSVFLLVSALATVWFFHESLDWRAVAGGTAILFIPQAIGWQLFVGLKTGFIPFRGKVSRAEDPVTFWLTVAGFLSLLALYAGGIAWLLFR